MIETITSKEIDRFAHLWCKLNAFHQELDELFGRPNHCSIWEERRTQLQEKAQGENLIQIVRIGKETVGYCFTYTDEKNRGEIESLYVLPEYRGEGYGKKLVKNALNWLDDVNCKDIEISVHPGNTNAISFYWSFGFATGHIMKKIADKSIERTA